jgi:hypothetical protein
MTTEELAELFLAHLYDLAEEAPHPNFLFSVNDTKYPNLLIHNFEDHPIIPDPQLPITSERFSQRFAIEMWGYRQAAFNGILYAGSELRVKQWNINGFNIRMVSEFERHSYQTS